MIAIVDYGVGNVQAFLNVYKRQNIEAIAAKRPDDLAAAKKLVLPGVGHFDTAMERLDNSGLRPALEELVLKKTVPVLGVCVGMQMLASSSDEGSLPGLGWIEGHVRSLATWPPAKTLPQPHMGWNDVRPVTEGGLFAHLDTDSRFYFLHSFYFECARPEHTSAVANYGADFTAAVQSGHVYGVQFHPEKSHHFGTRLLRNFAEL